MSGTEDGAGWCHPFWAGWSGRLPVSVKIATQFSGGSIPHLRAVTGEFIASKQMLSEPGRAARERPRADHASFRKGRSFLRILRENAGQQPLKFGRIEVDVSPAPKPLEEVTT